MSFVNKKLIRNLLIITGIFVLVFIILLIFSNKSDNTKKISYVQIEQKLVDATKQYLEKMNLHPTELGEKVQVSSDVLISNNYIKSFEKLTTDTNCFGTVSVQKDGEDQYNYMPYLVCDNYETNTFENEIASKLVENDGEDGVYFINGEYIYRGENVNNHLKIGKNDWRILKITNDGYMRIIKTIPETNGAIWDNRYNVDTNKTNGINEFEKSRLKERLIEIYDVNITSFPDAIKKYIVPTELCIGSRNIEDKSFNTGSECDEKSEKMYISLIYPSDFAYTSLDPDCKDFTTKSCQNYNYLNDVFGASWTTFKAAGSTSKACFINNRGVDANDANVRMQIQFIIYINADNIVKSGDGSEESPYTIY